MSSAMFMLAHLNEDHLSDHSVGALRRSLVLGNGYFLVRPKENGEMHASQEVQYRLDEEGFLATGTGARLQGRRNGVLSTLGDLLLAPPMEPALFPAGAKITNYFIDKWGKITVYLSDGTSFLRGQIMLQNFQEPQALVRETQGFYSNLSLAQPLPTPVSPGSMGLGSIHTDVLELSDSTTDFWFL